MGVKPSACKLVLLCLSDCHNSDNGRCDPGAGYITEFTGLDKKTVPEAISKLEQMGLITPRKRPGNSTQYTLHISENPAPVRGKGERRKTRPIPKLVIHSHTQERVAPNTGVPENGYTRKRKTSTPENGEGVYPKTGNEPTSNLQREPTTFPVATATAASAGRSVESFTLSDLGLIYSSDDPETEIFNHGVPLLGRFGLDFGSARNFLGMLIKKHSLGAVLDAVIISLLEQPDDPKAYMLGVLSRQGSEIPKDWQPPPPCLARLSALGIPDSVYQDARDVFVIWFREQCIRHNNFPELFVRWCQRDWERADGNRGIYLQRLRASAGLQEEFREPA